MPSILISILLIFIGLVIGIGLIIVLNYIRGNIASKKLDEMLEKTKQEAEILKKDTLKEAKEEASKYKTEVEEQLKEKKEEVKVSEDRLLQREQSFNKRDESLVDREKEISKKEKNIEQKQEEIQEEKVRMEEVKKEQLKKLQDISGYSKEKAREILLKKVEEEITKEISTLIKEKEAELKLEVDKKAKDLMIVSMQKYANEVVNEQTITVVNLPTDEMKGRLIGREGRNIRTIEAVTGVDLIIDDTPEAIVLSSFDPLRREIARLTIETLIKDGRIHPSRIEELYDKALKEVNEKIASYGEEALFELGITTKVDPELINIIGRLYFRTSYGQNALQHSMEVANLAAIMASELGEDTMLAKRAGLLHDIGKAIDFEMEGSHVEIGSDIAHKYKENDIIINAIESHHKDKEATSVIAVLVEIADIMSASRPGARNDSMENYIKRLKQLEEIANSFDGIDKTYAMQAGRELRVIVKPEEVDDLTSHKLARNIKTRIESEMKYPGTVKITVVRETRAQEEAK